MMTSYALDSCIRAKYLPNMHIHDFYSSDGPASKFSHLISYLIFHFLTDSHDDHAPF